jgi:hypothetical protein
VLVAYAVAGVGVLLLAGLVLVVAGRVRRVRRAGDEAGASLRARAAAIPALRSRGARGGSSGASAR